MSGHVRMTDFISCISVFNDNFCWLKERVKELKKDVRRLEEENKILKNKVDILEAKQAELKGRMIGWQNGFSEEVRRQFKRMEEH